MKQRVFGWGVAVVAILAASANAQQNWPPSRVMSAGSTVRLELRQVWNATVSGKDDDGDWTGKAQGADGKSATLFSFSQANGSFVFQIAYASSEFCLIAGPSAAQNLGPGSVVYRGSRLFKQNKDAQIQNDGDCQVTLGSSTQVSPQPLPQPAPQPQPMPQPQVAGLSWPPNFALGQMWRIEIGSSVYNVNLTENDRFGSPSGRVGAASISLYYQRSTEIAAIEVSEGQATTACRFKGAASASGSSLVNGEVLSRPNAQSPFQKQAGACRATLAGGGAPSPTVTPQPVGPQPIGPQPVTPQPVGPQPISPQPVMPQPVAPAPLNQNNPPNTSAWPVRLEVGQNWSASIAGLGAWNINFKNLDRDGDPTGPATPTAGGAALTASFYYAKNDNDVRLELFDNRVDYICIFERNEINGLTFNGWRYEETTDKKLRKTNQNCTMQYLGRVTLSALLEPFRLVI